MWSACFVYNMLVVLDQSQTCCKLCHCTPYPQACLPSQGCLPTCCLFALQSVDPTSTPQWLLDAASEMAAGGCAATSSAGAGCTMFGAATGVGGGSGTAAAQPIEIGSGGLLHHVRSLLLLRPVALHDVWLRKVRMGWLPLQCC